MPAALFDIEIRRQAHTQSAPNRDPTVPPPLRRFGLSSYNQHGQIGAAQSENVGHLRLTPQEPSFSRTKNGNLANREPTAASAEFGDPNGRIPNPGP